MRCPHATRLKTLRVARRIGGKPHDARLSAGHVIISCAIGRAGITHDKREGDGATPAGRWRLSSFHLRHAAPAPRPWRLIRRDDVWCDDARSFLYNRRMRSPLRLSHEAMWREDGLYDVVGVMDYNIVPRVRGRGSAIFFHIATAALGPTAGCVALRAQDMARLLPRLGRGVHIVVS